MPGAPSPTQPLEELGRRARVRESADVPRGGRAPLPARLRAGLGRRRHDLVGRHPARPGPARRWTTWSGTRTRTARCCTTCPTASSPTRTPPRPPRLLGTYDNAVALPRRPRPGHRPGEARSAWMGQQRGQSRCTVFVDGGCSRASGSRSTAGSRVARDAPRTLTRRPSGPTSTTRSRGSRSCWPARTRPSPSGVRDEQRGDGGDARRSRCAAPRRRGVPTTAPAATNAATSSSAEAALGADHDDDPAVRRDGERRRAARSRPRAARRPGRRRRPARTTSAVDASVGDLGEPGAPRLLGRLAGGRRASAPATCRLARPSRPRRCATPPTGTIRRRRSRSAPRRRARRGRPWGSPARRSPSGRRRARCRRPTRRSPRRPACRSTPTAPATDVPAPSVSTTCSPTRSRRTATAWCASSPSTVDLVADRDAAERRRRGGPGATSDSAGQCGLNASRSRPNTDLLPGRTWPVGFSSSRIAASSRSSSSCRASSRVGRLDDDGDDQVAATAAQAGHAAAAQHLLGAGLRAGPDVEVERRLELRTRRRRRRSTTSASRVGRVSAVPSAAAVIGSVTVQCRSLPCRVKVGVRRDVDLDVQVAGRTAAGADLALAGELDAGAGVDAGRDLDGQACGASGPGRRRSTRGRGPG